MKRTFTCIVCPNGCEITAEYEDSNILSVTGATCSKGEEYVRQELTAPKRTICSVVKTVFADAPVLPVRVSADIPKEMIFDVMGEINSVTLTERIGRGDVVIENVLGLGVDVISTSDLLKQNIYALTEG